MKKEIIKRNIEMYQQTRDEQAFNEIFTFAQECVAKTISRFDHPHLIQDFESECYSVLEKAVLDYDPNEAEFVTYIYQIFTRACTRVVKHSKAQKRDVEQFTVVYLDTFEETDANEGQDVFIPDSVDIVEDLIRREELNQALKLLDPIELKIADLSIQGYEDSKIAKMLNVSRSAIAQRKARMRKKRAEAVING